MKRFYRGIIRREPVGSAIQLIEPALQGTVIIKVADAATAGGYILFVMDCDDTQHKANLTVPGVEELSEERVVTLAAQYQPRRTVTRGGLFSTKKEKIEVPAFDLKEFLSKKYKR